MREITWLHNNQALGEPARQVSGQGGLAGLAGPSMMVSNNSLVLQRVGVNQRGQYACAASNSEGLSTSNKIELRVLRKYRLDF